MKNAFSPHIEDITLLLPDFAFRKVYWKNIKDNLESHLRMNAGRVRSDFLYRLNESSMQFLGILDKKAGSIISNTESAIDTGMKERNMKSKELEKLIKNIENKLNSLKNMKKAII